MQKDLIRTDEERAARLQLVKANRLQRQEKLLAASLSSTPATSSQKHNRRVPHDVSRNKNKTKQFYYISFVL